MGRVSTQKTEKSKPGRKRDRAATEAALRECAMALFSRKGFDATTTREIAEKAQVNEQLIQRYFGGKDGLLVSIMENFKDCFLKKDYALEIHGKNLQDELEQIFIAAGPRKYIRSTNTMAYVIRKRNSQCCTSRRTLAGPTIESSGNR